MASTTDRASTTALVGSEGNGRRPARLSYNITPKDHTSLAAIGSRPRKHSGLA